MDPIQLQGQTWYVANDLKMVGSPFRGVSRVRPMVQKLKLSSKDYIYATVKLGVYRADPKGSNKAKLLISDSWLQKQKWFVGADQETDDDSNLPPVLELDETEMFRDDHGKVIEIEVRGERDPARCYFRVKDVEKAFGVSQLRTSLTKRTSRYQKGTDFIVLRVNTIYTETTKKSVIRNHLFLTFQGVLRAIFCSNSSKTGPFIEWATKTLFTVQFGTDAQKEQLIEEIGRTYTGCSEYLRSAIEPISVVYWYRLGRVGDLREALKIDPKYPDEMIVGKFGRAIDHRRRWRELKKVYGKYGAKLELQRFSIIDPKFSVEAENQIRQFMKNSGLILDHPNHDELIVYRESDLKTIDREYLAIKKLFAGRMEEVTDELVEMRTKCEKAELMSELAELKQQKSERKLAQREKQLADREKKLEAAKQEITRLKKQRKEWKKMVQTEYDQIDVEIGGLEKSNQLLTERVGWLQRSLDSANEIIGELNRWRKLVF